MLNQIKGMTISAEEVKEIVLELARLTGGILLNIHEDNNTIIMYREKEGTMLCFQFCHF